MRGSRSRGCHERPAFRVIRPPELVGRAEKREPALQHEIGRAQRLNSSHDQISYAVFCLKKKNTTSELQSRSDLVCRLLLEKKDTQEQVTQRETARLSCVGGRWSRVQPDDIAVGA